MKKWYLIDDCLHSARQVFETALDCNSQEEAFDIAVREWEALSAHDQRARDDFYIGFADVDGDGCVDYDTMTDIISIKKGEKPVKETRFITKDRFGTPCPNNWEDIAAFLDDRIREEHDALGEYAVDASDPSGLSDDGRAAIESIWGFYQEGSFTDCPVPVYS